MPFVIKLPRCYINKSKNSAYIRICRFSVDLKFRNQVFNPPCLIRMCFDFRLKMPTFLMIQFNYCHSLRLAMRLCDNMHKCDCDLRFSIAICDDREGFVSSIYQFYSSFSLSSISCTQVCLGGQMSLAGPSPFVPFCFVDLDLTLLLFSVLLTGVCHVPTLRRRRRDGYTSAVLPAPLRLPS
jgi:hypothetical protein